jgi:hypothetical protein
MRLPNEDATRTLIEQKLRSELDVASEVLGLGTGIFTSGNRISPGDGVDDLVLMVTLGLIAKSCKQYRAIGELIQMGLGEVADSNARMLLETTLAVLFLMRRRVVLKENGKTFSGIMGKPLTTRFRARLYLAYDAFNGRKFAQGVAGTRGLKRKIRRAGLTAIEKTAKDWEAEIGPDWTKRLKRGFSGLTVKDLAESFGYGELYPVYRIMSGGVHASDSTDFIHPDDSSESGVRFSVSASVEGVANTLKFASVLLVHIVQAADARLGLGLKTASDDLMKRVETMRIEFPK